MPTKLFEKGKPRPKNAGRKKGTPNKFTTLKQAFINAYNSKAMGGEKGMTEVFSANSFTKREFYKLISKMLPSNVGVEHGGNIDHTVFVMPRPKKKKENAD